MNIADFKEKICLELFSDTYKNVSTLLNIISKAYNDGLIDRKLEYKDLITINAALNSNDESILKTLKKYEGQRFEEVLYDAYKDAMYVTFESIKSTCYDINIDDFDKHLSKEVGIQVYNIKKQPKKLLINVSRFEKNSNIKDSELKKLLNMYVNERSNRNNNQDFKSLSYIDNHDIKAYRDINNYITFVYPPQIPNEFLITITRKDAWIKFKDKQVYSSKAPYFSNNQTLLDSTNDFNEVAILRKDPHSDKAVKPLAIFCSQNITENEIRIAKILNIPIIFSETKYVKKYANKKKFNYYYNNQRDYDTPDFDEVF